MKELKSYIKESFIPWNIKVRHYTDCPKTKNELIKVISKHIKKEGNECDLNDIDVSHITDMSELFYSFNEFNGDISNWDVSNVKTMRTMFFGSKFNGDISNWDVSNVKNMAFMFDNSKFNQDISKWKVQMTCNVYNMFLNCPIKKEHKPIILQ